MVQPLIAFEQTGARRTGIHRGGCPQKYILDERGRRLILAKYDGSTESINELMHFFPGYPRYVIRKWGSLMGLARKREPRWTAEDEEYLATQLHRMSLGAIAQHVGRTKTAVRLKAKRLGINKTQEGYTMRGLMLGLGMTSHHRIQYWIAQGWIHGERRHTERSTNDFWFFSDRAVRELVRYHPEEIDPRRVDWLWLVDVLLGGNNGIGSLA